MAVAVEVSVSRSRTTDGAVAELREKACSSELNPSCVFLFYSESYDDTLLVEFVRAQFPGVPVIGGTSSHGVLDQGGAAGDESVGMFVIDDPDGDYGVAAARLGADPEASAEDVTLRALQAAGSAGELPELVWVYQAAGTEEAVLRGIRRVVGNRCPIVGGTAAAATMEGERRQLSAAGPIEGGVVIAALFPSGGVSYAYQGGYQPTGVSGVVTRLVSPREIAEIDGHPAAEVYQRWTDNEVSPEVIARGGPIGGLSVTAPLGVDMGAAGEVTYFRLLQPAAVTPTQGLATAAAVEHGSTVYAMRGSQRGLVRRPGRVAAAAAVEFTDGRRDIAGVLMTYCAGCRAAVGDDLAESIAVIAAELPDTPFLGCFSGGEQGPALGENVHANLMISAVVFGR